MSIIMLENSSDSQRAKNLSVYDINWQRIGQFILSKVKLLKRASKLLVEVQV